MRRIMFSLICLIVLSLIGINNKQVHANETELPIKSEFARALEDHLQNTINYYHVHSSKIIKSFDIQGEVYKLIRSDNPNTPENEEETEEYNSHIIIGFVEYEQKRDTFFIFKIRDVYYYDLDKNEFLSASNVFGNKVVKDFFMKHKDDIVKEMTGVSIAICLMLLSSLIIVPILIMIFHNNGGNSNKSHCEGANIGG